MQTEQLNKEQAKTLINQIFNYVDKANASGEQHRQFNSGRQALLDYLDQTTIIQEDNPDQT